MQPFVPLLEFLPNLQSLACQPIATLLTWQLASLLVLVVDLGIVADATVSGAVDATENLGVDSGSLANSASNITDDGGDGGVGGVGGVGGGSINTTLPIPLKFTTTTKLT